MNKVATIRCTGGVGLSHRHHPVQIPPGQRSFWTEILGQRTPDTDTSQPPVQRPL